VTGDTVLARVELYLLQQEADDLQARLALFPGQAGPEVLGALPGLRERVARAEAALRGV
jgi:hypothetical protein